MKTLSLLATACASLLVILSPPTQAQLPALDTVTSEAYFGSPPAPGSPIFIPLTYYGKWSYDEKKWVGQKVIVEQGKIVNKTFVAIPGSQANHSLQPTGGARIPIAGIYGLPNGGKAADGGTVHVKQEPYLKGRQIILQAQLRGVPAGKLGNKEEVIATSPLQVLTMP